MTTPSQASHNTEPQTVVWTLPDRSNDLKLEVSFKLRDLIEEARRADGDLGDNLREVFGERQKEIVERIEAEVAAVHGLGMVRQCSCQDEVFGRRVLVPLRAALEELVPNGFFYGVLGIKSEERSNLYGAEKQADRDSAREALRKVLEIEGIGEGELSVVVEVKDIDSKSCLVISVKDPGRSGKFDFVDKWISELDFSPEAMERPYGRGLYLLRAQYFRDGKPSQDEDGTMRITMPLE